MAFQSSSLDTVDNQLHLAFHYSSDSHQSNDNDSNAAATLAGEAPSTLCRNVATEGGKQVEILKLFP